MERKLLLDPALHLVHLQLVVLVKLIKQLIAVLETCAMMTILTMEITSMIHVMTHVVVNVIV